MGRYWSTERYSRYMTVASVLLASRFLLLNMTRRSSKAMVVSGGRTSTSRVAGSPQRDPDSGPSKRPSADRDTRHGALPKSAARLSWSHTWSPPTRPRTTSGEDRMTCASRNRVALRSPAATDGTCRNPPTRRSHSLRRRLDDAFAPPPPIARASR